MTGKPGPIADNTHHIVKKIFKECDARKISRQTLADWAGVNVLTLRNWSAGGTCPDLFLLECVVAALDYQIIIIPRKKKRKRTYKGMNNFYNPGTPLSESN